MIAGERFVDLGHLRNGLVSEAVDHWPIRSAVSEKQNVFPECCVGDNIV